MFAYIHTYIHTYTHARGIKLVVRTYIHTYIHTYTRTYTYIHTYARARGTKLMVSFSQGCIHTYIHACTLTYLNTSISSYRVPGAYWWQALSTGRFIVNIYTQVPTRMHIQIWRLPCAQCILVASTEHWQVHGKHINTQVQTRMHIHKMEASIWCQQVRGKHTHTGADTHAYTHIKVTVCGVQNGGEHLAPAGSR